VVDVHTPVLSGLVPTLVGGVGAEDEEKSEGGTGHGEDVQGQGKLREELDKSRVLDTVKVGVTMSDGVVKDDEACDDSNNTNLAEEVLVNAGTEDGYEIVEEAILRSVLLPIVVGVDRTTVLALFLAIGKIRDILHVTKGVEA